MVITEIVVEEVQCDNSYLERWNTVHCRNDVDFYYTIYSGLIGFIEKRNYLIIRTQPSFETVTRRAYLMVCFLFWCSLNLNLNYIHSFKYQQYVFLEIQWDVCRYAVSGSKMLPWRTTPSASWTPALEVTVHD